MKFLIFFLFISNLTYAANDSLRAELGRLLKERKVLFDEYSSSLEKKSGIFGNKTKNDLRDSQDKLTEIVSADNKIIGVLNRTVDFRNFEKTNMTYDVTSFQNRIQNLTSLNESLLKQNNEYREQVKDFKISVKKLRLYNVLFLLALIVTIGFFAGRKYLKL